MKKGHIFVQCASYRDPELGLSIRSALENADNPQNVSFGICWQGAIGRQVKTKELERDLCLGGMKQCRVVLIHMDSSKGIGYARHKAQMMYEDEEFTLQIDSHMRFMPSWDTMCLEMLGMCPSKKPMLTAYLTDYEKDEDPGCWRLGVEEFDEEDNVVVQGQNIITANKPQLGILASGHFVFAESKLFQEAPIDPNMQFLYEETLIAPRAWTNGWDIFYPHKAPMQHKWNRSYRKTNWQDLDIKDNVRHCRELYYQLVGIRPGYHNFGPYGMGNARTLQEYERFSGINFKKRELKPHAYKGYPRLV